MQTIRVRTSENVVVEYPIAPIGDRVLASILDFIIKLVYIFFVAGALISMDVDIVWPYVVFLGLPWMVYHLLFEIFMNGQSPGKRVFRLQVARLDGSPPSGGDYVLRWVFGVVDFYVLTGALALLIVAVGGQGQRLGDIVAGTCVIKLSVQHAATPSRMTLSSYVPAFPQVAKLDGSDIKLIQRAIEANTEYENIQPTVMVANKFQELLGIQTSLAPSDFLNTIVKDYNHIKSR